MANKGTKINIKANLHFKIERISDSFQPSERYYTRLLVNNLNAFPYFALMHN